MLNQPLGRVIFLSVVLLFSSIGIFVAVLAPDLASLVDNSLQVGDVAAQDILAPSAMVYESPELTELQRDLAESAITPVYTPVDTSVARLQLERLRASLAFISSVRADRYASLEQKLVDLAALQDVRISLDSSERLLLLAEARWQAVQQEAILTLERVMRETIRDDRLDDARRTVPASVSLSLPEDQASVVAELVAAFVAPNSYYSDDLTDDARQQARQDVQPVSREFAQGEKIVSRGQVITSLDIEALQQFGLAQPRQEWEKVTSAALLTGLVVLFFVFYLRRNPRLLQSRRALVIFVCLFLIFLLGARLVIPGHTVIPYLYPTAAFSLTIAVIFSPELALISILPLAALIAYGLPNALDLTLYTVMSSFFGILSMRKVQRILTYLWAGAVVAFSGIVIVVLYKLPQPGTDLVGVLTLIGAAALYGLASAGLSVVLQFYTAQAVRQTTPLQLIELSRPDHPLLQLILRAAPGTYQHSLQVSNLAEQAAERINADTLLVRVGSLYHDAGKALNPFYFIENQLPGNINPHTELDPQVSAATIIQHVPDGLRLAQQYHLPPRIQDFISEHHGTMLASYQYTQALQAAGSDPAAVDEEGFRYPGPRPQSRETALLMLADGSEARVRAERPHDEQQLREIVQDVINQRVKMGQLDDTSLSLRDLSSIVDSFVTTMRGVYHPRIEYPKLVPLPPGEADLEEDEPELLEVAPDFPVPDQAEAEPADEPFKPVEVTTEPRKRDNALI